MALLCVPLALGLNIVAGYAGLPDLGYVAFFAIGVFITYALLVCPTRRRPSRCLPPCSQWLAYPDLGDHSGGGSGLAALFGVLLGAPTRWLRGDYLAIVTLGFGEIIRVFMNNLDHPINLTNGPSVWARLIHCRSLA